MKRKRYSRRTDRLDPPLEVGVQCDMAAHDLKCIKRLEGENLRLKHMISDLRPD